MFRMRSTGRLGLTSLVLCSVFVLPGWTRADGPGHGGWGVDLDHGVGPYRGAYDAPIPGWRPGPVCARHGRDDGPWHGWLNLNSHTPYVRTGLYRYPLYGFGGYIPAGPHDDGLYVTGRSPLHR